MMKYTYIILASLMMILWNIACTDELESPFVEEGEPVELVIPFNAQDNFKVEVKSRATLPEDREKKIYNFYIYIFDSKGNKIYGHYFDNQNLGATKEPNYWQSTDPFDKGTIHIKTHTANACMVYAITNIDADMVNVSPEKLNIIQKEEDIKALVSTMNQNTVARNGYFPMSAQIGPVDIGNNGTGMRFDFKRLDAKICFNFFVGEPAAGKQRIEQFVPRSWQVMNVPTSSYVFPQEGVSVPNVTYFNTESVNFESKTVTQQKVGNTDSKTPVTTHQFSFYMQENLKIAQSIPPSQAARSLRIKKADGTNGGWVYAPQNATYLIVIGRVIMNDPISTGQEGSIEGKTLNADVVYIIHLGDFSSSMQDYSVQRNHQYTYNVKIKGVDDIRVEVETSKTGNPIENSPGAFGDVTIAKEEIYECDAHYSSHVLTFHAKNIDPDRVTWYVKTPFCEGKPTIIDGVDVPTGLDYKWVHFQVNQIDPNDNMYYEQKRQKFDPNNSMDVIELVKYLRDQTREWIKDPNSIKHNFDKTPEEKGGPKICVTAHVDEYYYEVNPITGRYERDLAKRFVNQPMRLMHILSDSEISKDQESLIVGSASTIQQRSIQTIYNPANPNVHSGWGCEYWDEYPSNYVDRWIYGGENSGKQSRGNIDPYNGRVNTCKEWQLCNSDGTFNNNQKKSWDTFVDFEAENTSPLLKTGYQNLRYTCMTRNRDNNGNGLIDEDEVRWYMASVRQLIGIWMGADGISNDARLYNKEGRGTGNSWRQHIISSTAFTSDNSNEPTIIWAEEGSSTGGYKYSYNNLGDKTIYSVRCVRNIGEYEGKDITKAPIKVAPAEYITMKDNKDGSYTLDMTYLNEKSIRYFTSRELDWSDENSMQNRVYKTFDVAPVRDHPRQSQKIGTNAANVALDKNIKSNPYCPPGYRLPNQREITAMAYYLPFNYWEGCDAVLTRTKYSFGFYGSKLDETKVGWCFIPNHNEQIGNVQMAHLDNGNDVSGNTTLVTRCVRDVE